MITSEPERTPYDLHFRLFGIPVRVHPFFWVIAVLLGIRGSEADPIEMLLWVGAVFVSILVHELGHALAARSNGYQPWITLHAFGGLASYQGEPRSLGSRLFIIFAGPLAGFAFAALIVAGIILSGQQVALVPSLVPVRFEFYSSQPLNILLWDLLFINILWGLINLLPVYPLDGGQISRELFLQASPYDGIRQSLMLSIITGAAIAVYALLFSGSFYLALLFGYMAYMSYATLQAYQGRGGGRGW